MKTFYLIFKEAVHRKLNFLLSILATVTAVAMFISFFATGEASRRETVRLTRDMGFNLRVIPRETNMDQFWTTGFSEHTMPEEYANKFADRKDVSYNHLIATLQRTITWNGMQIILTGIAPKEVIPPGKKKRPMTFTMEPKTAYTIKRGTIFVGFDLAKKLEIKKGDRVDLLGKSFVVARCRPETGTDDDVRIHAHLSDVQSLLNEEGRINEIKALECVCSIHGSLPAGKTPLVLLREELESVLPDAKVVLIAPMAAAREQQRLMMEAHFALVMPIVLAVCAAWIGILAMINVRDRRHEIGVMRAVGYGSGRIILLFLGKAFIIGVVGAAVGFGIGTILASRFGPDIFKITAKMIKPEYGLLGWSLIAAPVFAMISSFIPTMIAVTQDPAITLSRE